MALLAALVCMSCATARAPVTWSFGPLVAEEASYENEDGHWRISEPASVGLDDMAVRLHLELAIRTGADAVLVTRGEATVCEWYSARYVPPIGAMSSTKSVTSILCGIMRDQGMLSFEDLVGRYVPEWREGRRGMVTIRHLLSQTGGLSRTTEAGKSVGYPAEKNAFVKRLEPDREPGTVWSYSNEGVQLLSPVMEAASGQSLSGFARAHLFEPLGMLRTAMKVSGSDTWTYADMETTPRDFARLGALMAGQGVFAGRRIVSAEYVAEAVSPCALDQGYGLLWWLYSARDGVAGYGAEGYLDTSMYVFPERDLVVVRMQKPRASFTGANESGNYQGLAWRLFPAMVGNASSARLRGVLEDIRMPEGTKPAPKAEAVSVGSRVLERAIEDSAAGRTDEVIAALLPFVRSADVSRDERAQACLTLALAYLRKGDRRRAAAYVREAREAGAAELPGWWGENYRSMEKDLRS